MFSLDTETACRLWSQRRREKHATRALGCSFGRCSLCDPVRSGSSSGSACLSDEPSDVHVAAADPINTEANALAEAISQAEAQATTGAEAKGHHPEAAVEL